LSGAGIGKGGKALRSIEEINGKISSLYFAMPVRYGQPLF